MARKWERENTPGLDISLRTRYLYHYIAICMAALEQDT